MRVLEAPLFFLPIHYRSRAKYYQDHDEWVETQKEGVENDWGGKPFGQLDYKIQRRWENDWFWPLWKFNDIVGYLDIGMDHLKFLTANIYLKRKYFHRSSKERQRKRYHTTLENHQFLYFRQIRKYRVNVEDNGSYLPVLEKILSEAEKKLKKRNPNFKLWFPPFNFNCFNFVEAYKQAMNKA